MEQRSPARCGKPCGTSLFLGLSSKRAARRRSPAWRLRQDWILRLAVLSLPPMNPCPRGMAVAERCYLKSAIDNPHVTFFRGSLSCNSRDFFWIIIWQPRKAREILHFFQNFPKYAAAGDPEDKIKNFIDGLLLSPLAAATKGALSFVRRSSGFPVKSSLKRIFTRRNPMPCASIAKGSCWRVARGSGSLSAVRAMTLKKWSIMTGRRWATRMYSTRSN